VTHYGNCLLGALVLMVRYRTWRLRALWRGSVIPHFYVVDRDGKKWHFRVVQDVLPWPLGALLFVGKYRRMRMTPRTQAQDVAAAAAEAEEQRNNRPQDSFYEVAGQEFNRVGLAGDHSVYGSSKEDPRHGA